MCQTMDGKSVVTRQEEAVGSTGRLSLLDLVPWQLMSSWCAIGWSRPDQPLWLLRALKFARPGWCLGS